MADQLITADIFTSLCEQCTEECLSKKKTMRELSTSVGTN